MTDFQQLDADRQKFLATVRDLLTRPENWFANELDIRIEGTIRSLRELQALAAFARNDPATRI